MAARQRTSGGDQTDGKAATERVRLVAAAMAAARNAVMITDRKGIIQWVNPAFTQLTGYAAEEALGQKPDLLKSGQHDRAFYQNLWSTVLSGKGWHGQLINRRKDGRLYVDEQSISPVRNDRGDITHFVAIQEDITERERREESLREVNEKLTSKVHELEQRAREIHWLSEMGEMLHSSQNIEEAYEVIARYTHELFPDASGDVCELAASREGLEVVAAWGNVSPPQLVFTPDECWALRLGRLHFVPDSRQGLGCPHLDGVKPISSLCVPLMAQNDTLGVLNIWRDVAPVGESAEASEQRIEREKRLGVAVAEQVSLALANLRLRETLRSQSIRDSLTGLYNRRYMEESLERELRRATRSNRPLAVILLDLDHFKEFNDSLGHEAGDILLREFGGLLQGSVRKNDLACRYGGDEFILILHEASLEVARQRGERLREALKNHEVQYGGRSLGTVTVSLGIAVFPGDGSTSQDLLRTADAALYRAKVEGRDRVAVASAVAA
jgi:diguanylate cyclase (GGDEF)-like protein/PAS domain S-box-containing protein